MAHYDPQFIADMLTDDPEVFKEAGLDGGRHPGRENTPKDHRDLAGGGESGFERTDAGNYTLYVITAASPETSQITNLWRIDDRSVEHYLPLYAIFRENRPHAMSSAKNGSTWYNTQDYPLSSASPALLKAKAMAELGVPEEMWPPSKEQFIQQRYPERSESGPESPGGADNLDMGRGIPREF